MKQRSCLFVKSQIELCELADSFAAVLYTLSSRNAFASLPAVIHTVVH